LLEPGFFLHDSRLRHIANIQPLVLQQTSAVGSVRTTVGISGLCPIEATKLCPGK